MKNLSKNPEQLYFNISSGKLNITDPCYNIDTKCALFNLPAENGEWSVIGEYEDAKDWGYRVKSIVAMRTDKFYSVDSSYWKMLSDDIGVDSGQCGIFDSGNYPQGDSTGEYEDKNGFYGKVCELTLNDNSNDDDSIPHSTYGIVDNFGVATSTGYGDGCYTAYGIMNDAGELVAVKVVFLEDEIEEDYWDDDEEEWEDETEEEEGE